MYTLKLFLVFKELLVGENLDKTKIIVFVDLDLLPLINFSLSKLFSMITLKQFTKTLLFLDKKIKN